MEKLEENCRAVNEMLRDVFQIIHVRRFYIIILVNLCLRVQHLLRMNNSLVKF